MTARDDVDGRNSDSRQMRSWLHLHLTARVGPTIFRQLLETFGSAEAALRADHSALVSTKGVGSITADKIVSSRSQVDVDKELELVSKAGVTLLSWDSPAYPVGLKNIYDPPAVLYVRGRLEPEDATAIAVVGTRRASRYGLEQAERFGAALARAGFTVVSGLARGIDSAAHQGALKAPCGTEIAGTPRLKIPAFSAVILLRVSPSCWQWS